MLGKSGKKKEPDIGDANELRRHKRIDLHSKVYCTKYISEGKEIELEAPIELMLLNISASGFGVISPTPFEKDSLLVLNITLEEEKYERVSARVIWETAKGNQYRQGLTISNMSGKLFTHISKLDNSIKTEI